MSFILRAAFWLTVLAFLLPTGGNEAALLLGIGRNTLTRKIQDFGISDEVVEET